MFKTLIFPILFFSLINCSTSQTLRVKRLALIDDNGVERLVLTTNSSDVQVNGKTYKRRSPASGIILNNAKGDEVGGIAMLDDGTASFTLDGYSKDGIAERASLYVFPDGTSGVIVKDTKGNIRAKLGVDEKMNTVFTLAGADEKAKVTATVQPDGKTTIVQPKSK